MSPASAAACEGFIPTGWYPTAARALPSGALVVLNGKGLRSYPNPHGPNPARSAASRCTRAMPADEYVGRMQTGTASWIDPFTAEQLDGLDQRRRWPIRPTATPSWTSPTRCRAIQHVIYIVKENRTYDQVLGDMKEGNGDPSLVLFGENVTPNLHKLAREFVLLDNFYVNADVSADGHNWSTAAIAPDYVQKLWPNKYARPPQARTTSKSSDPASLPPAGYIWTNAAAAGRLASAISATWWTTSRKPRRRAASRSPSVRDPVLAKVTNRCYRGFDLDYPDVERAKVFLSELAEYEKTGKMPRLIVMRLGNDHTSGTDAGQARAALRWRPTTITRWA